MLSFNLTALLLSMLCMTRHVAGTIVSPPHRNQTGPAMSRACGVAVVDLLKSQPGAALADVKAAINLNLATTCEVTFCGGYQLADNQRNGFVVQANQTIPLVVNTVPPASSSAPAQLNFVVRLVKPTVDLQPSVQSAAIEMPYATGTQTLNVNLFAHYASEIGNKQCIRVGQCQLSWQLVDKSSGDVVEAACLDFTVAS